jgi:hypothetical protein
MKTERHGLYDVREDGTRKLNWFRLAAAPVTFALLAFVGWLVISAVSAAGRPCGKSDGICLDRKAEALDRLTLLIAEAEVSDMLKDPGAAEFGETRFGPRGVCGTVNAKNGFGAYNGFAPWAKDLKTGAVAIDDGSPQFQKFYNRLCR